MLRLGILVDFIFQAAKHAGWLGADEYPKTSHVSFGLVVGEDGKRYRTRDSDVVRLADLLDDAKIRMLKIANEVQHNRLKSGMVSLAIQID